MIILVWRLIPQKLPFHSFLLLNDPIESNLKMIDLFCGFRWGGFLENGDYIIIILCCDSLNLKNLRISFLQSLRVLSGCKWRRYVPCSLLSLPVSKMGVLVFILAVNSLCSSNRCQAGSMPCSSNSTGSLKSFTWRNLLNSQGGRVFWHKLLFFLWGMCVFL